MLGKTATLLMLTSAVGCVGQIDGAAGETAPAGAPRTATGSAERPGSTPTSVPPALRDPALRFRCTDTSARGSTQPNVRRLTVPEIANTLGDVFAGTTVVDALEPHLRLLPDDHLVTQIEDIAPQFDSATLTPLIDLMMTVADEMASK